MREKHFEAALLADNVALKVHAYVHGFAALRGLTAPDTSIVFLKTGNIRKALCFDPRPGLTFGKAVGSSDGRARIRRTIRRVHGRCICIEIGAGTGCCCAKAGKATATTTVAIKVLRIDFSFLMDRR